jgi:hypothetical protein
VAVSDEVLQNIYAYTKGCLIGQREREFEGGREGRPGGGRREREIETARAFQQTNTHTHTIVMCERYTPEVACGK